MRHNYVIAATLFVLILSIPQSSALTSDCENPYIFVSLEKNGIDEINQYFAIGLSNKEISEKNNQLLDIIEEKYHGKICDIEAFITEVNSKISLGLTDEQIAQIIDMLNNKTLVPDVIKEQMPSSVAMTASSIPKNFLRPFGPHDVAPYLIGRVALISVFVNVNNDNWTTTDRNHAVDRGFEVKKWMNDNAPSYVDLNVTVAYVTSYATVKTNPYNCKNTTCFCRTWMDEAIKGFGYSDKDDDGTSIDDYLENAITQLNVDHASLFFMLHSAGTPYIRSYSCDPTIALFFYEWPCIFGLCIEEKYNTYLHETLHNFGAADQYYQSFDQSGCTIDSCTRSYTWGYKNANCEHCNSSSQPSIMKYPGETTNIDYWSKGMIGWLDKDEDKVPDPLDSCMHNYGTWCNGCPKPTCSACAYAYCPTSDDWWKEPYCKISDSTTSCGVLDCDYLDTECRDYSDKTLYCSGDAGGCLRYAQTCDTYTNKPAGTECSEKLWEYGCPWGTSAGADVGKQWHYSQCTGTGTCAIYHTNWTLSKNCSKEEHCYWNLYGIGGNRNESNYFCQSGCLPTIEICNDEIDNDCDGYTDLSDSDCCIPNWTLNDTWSDCINDTHYKNYYDTNNCDLAPPPPINQSCAPSMVTNLHTTFANESAIAWEWTNPPEPDYYVAIVYYGNSEQCKGPSCTLYYADSAYAPLNTTTITGLNESTEYFVHIYTYDINWNGNYTAPGLIPSNNITGWTKEGVCIPIWTLNNTWSACTDGYQYKRYHDLNFCNNPEDKPQDLKKRCPTILEIYRTLPPSATIGQTFNITLEVDVNESKKPAAYVIYETIPDGFDIISTGGMSYTPSTRTLKLMVYESTYYGTKVEDRTITYTLKYKKEHTTIFSGYSRYSSSDHPIWGDNNFTGIIDRTPPTVFIIDPEDNATYTESKTINVTAYSDEIGEIRESVDGNTSTLICADCNSIIHNLTLENGNHNITIYATDAAGNTGNHTHKFKIDVCIPNWILNSTWSQCINGTQTKNYYDINNCNKTETKPKDITAPCNNTPPPIEVFRFLQPYAFVGEKFNVTLQIEVNETRKPKSYVLYETIPEGFNMANTGGMQYTPSTHTLKLMVFESTYYNTHVEDRIITYTLKPIIPTTGSFIGYIRYNIQNYDTEGDSTVEVNS